MNSRGSPEPFLASSNLPNPKFNQLLTKNKIDKPEYLTILNDSTKLPLTLTNQVHTPFAPRCLPTWTMISIVCSSPSPTITQLKSLTGVQWTLVSATMRSRLLLTRSSMRVIQAPSYTTHDQLLLGRLSESIETNGLVGGWNYRIQDLEKECAISLRPNLKVLSSNRPKSQTLKK